VIFKPCVDGFWLADADRGVEYRVDRLRRDRHELVGELAVSCDLAGARVVDGVLSFGTFNFSSPRARQEHAKRLAERARTNGKVDWQAQLEEVCQRVLLAERAGAPALVLRDLPRPVAELDHTVDGFRFPQRHPTILFGDGGTMKSYFSLHLACSLSEQSGLRVALFDWELDERQHRLRLEMLRPHGMPDVRYVRCDRPLMYEVDRLQRIARTDALDYVVYDSAGFACNGRPEDAEQALAYFRAVRQIGPGSLHIAHITKAEGGDQKPFGSSFWHNSARSTWFVTLAATSPDGRVSTLGLFNRKANLGPLQPAVGVEVSFEGEVTRFGRVDVASIEELAEKLPIWQRMQKKLRRGPQTLATLAEDLGEKIETLDRTVRRKSGMFTRVTSSDDHISRIALVETRAS
jgi:hypothetical protein